MNRTPHARADATREGVDGWALLGTLLGPMIHEIRNGLNVIGLQSKILRRSLGPEHQRSLDVITKTVAETAALLDWARLRHEQLDAIEAPFDLARAIVEALERFAVPAGQSDASAIAVRFRGPESLVRRVHSPFEIRQWIGLLLHDLLRRASERTRAVAIVLEPGEGEVVLRLRLEQPAESSEKDGPLMLVPPQEPLHPLEAAILQSVPRRLGIPKERGPDGEEVRYRLKAGEES